MYLPSDAVSFSHAFTGPHLYPNAYPRPFAHGDTHPDPTANGDCYPNADADAYPYSNQFSLTRTHRYPSAAAHRYPRPSDGDTGPTRMVAGAATRPHFCHVGRFLGRGCRMGAGNSQRRLAHRRV